MRISLLGTKVPGNEGSWERKFQGTKVPPMEVSFLGTKLPWYESSIIRKIITAHKLAHEEVAF